MDLEEIKRTKTMFEVANDYGIRSNKANMCSCPFHGKDRHPSMKLYKDGFKCFTCNESGDIFKFVMLMDNCTFKEAFVKLGGEYQKPQDDQESKVNDFRNYRRAKEKERRAQLQKDLLRRARFWSEQYSFWSGIIRFFPPMSDDWCDCIEQKEYSWAKMEMLRKEADEVVRNIS